jgi:hypothetical protein
MGDLDRGKDLFAKRIEYPLPKKAGARDYLFCLIPAGGEDGYRDCGKKFFQKFYKNHVQHDVRTLESLIDKLAADVDGGITHIREITILSHGNALGLLFPVLNGVTDTNLREYKYLTAFSLACLQKDLDADKFVALQRRRKKVLGKLGDESWVTVRACNFGRSREAMYAFYAFFGGKANVYAPMAYQFFGTPPVYEGMRLDSRLRVHEHLVRQHFFPKDVHTLERKDAIVTAIVDRGKFSEPFEIASMRVDDPLPDEAAAYEPFIDQLNASTIGAKLKSVFDTNGFKLSPRARVSVVSASTQWVITDNLAHEGNTFRVEFQVYESIELGRSNRQMAVLRAGAAIAEKPSGRETLPIQLFLSQEENEAFRGKRLTLAAYADAPNAPAADRARFDAVLAVLKQGAFASGAVDIKAELKDREQIELTPQATLAQLSSTGPADAQRITWAIRDKKPFRVMLEHPLTGDGAPAHTITVYDDYASKRDLIWAQYETIASRGSDPDTPGTELAAYLDRLSIDDLSNVLEYLRTPFKPGHGFYLQQVQAAARRKKGFAAWLAATVPGWDQAVLPSDPYTDLSISEREDYHDLSYTFEFNAVWAEVRASNPPKTAVRDDLFAEDDLAKKFRIPDEVMTNRDALPDIDADSPAADIEALRALERVGFEAFFKADKNIVEHTPEPAELSCAEFEAIVAKWQEVKDLEPEAMREALELAKTKDGTSYWTVVSDFKTHVKGWFKILDITIPGSDWIVMTKKDLAKLVAKKVPFLARIAMLQVIVEIEFVFTIPFTMWMDFAEAQVQMRDVWYTLGRIVVIRQWLRRLEDLTYLKENDFPDRIAIDVTTPVGDNVYYLSRYMHEQFESGHLPMSNFIPAPDRFKDGFDQQAAQMDRLGEAILEVANESIGELMRDSGLDSCKVEVLRKAGIFDISIIKALIVREWAQALLNKLPTV